MTVRVRPFVDGDYPRYVAIANAVVPEFRQSEAEARHWDASFDRERYHLSRVVAEDADGVVVGWGQIGHMADQFHPDRYSLDLQVDPPARGRGVGAALYDRLRGELADRRATAVRAEAKESNPVGIGFLERRGFVEQRRAWESWLDVPSFDAARFAGATERASAQGIAITTLAAEQARDPNALRAAHDLYLVCCRDQPEIDPITDVPFEHFVNQEASGPQSLPDGYFLAKDGDRYVGQSYLFASEEEPDVLHQGLTGVLPEYRGRGIAMALKLGTVAYAREHGKREIRTWNDTANRPMLRINEAMGFVKQPVWIILQKELASPTDA